MNFGHAMDYAVICRPFTAEPRIQFQDLVGFVVDKVALEQVAVRTTLHSHISFTYLRPCRIVAVESVDK